MASITQSNASAEKIFHALFLAKAEDDVDKVFRQYPQIFEKSENWYPLGGIESNFGVIENQQSSPIAALIEKITNSIDAILMKRCYEEDIDPKSPHAPHSIEEAVGQFFKGSKSWDLPKFRRVQAEEIQVIADGPKFTPSLIIYDDGEGQHPEDFEDTFLSLLRGNKNEIHFVQGKYNMGGNRSNRFLRQKTLSFDRFQKI